MNRDHPDVAADRLADRISFGLIVGFSLLSWIVLSSSKVAEHARDGVPAGAISPWLVEATSHFAMLIAYAGLLWCFNRLPLHAGNWQRRWLYYLSVFLPFTAIHIVLMWLFRTWAYPWIAGVEYTQTLASVDFWAYEARKDFYSYLMVIGLFLGSRQIQELRLENRSIREDAERAGRITLKSGGRRILLEAADITHASAAANYVEVYTTHGQYLARTTLTAFEQLLADASNEHVRIHRSHIVHRPRVKELLPGGNGEAVVVLDNTVRLPISRRYRDQLA
ncbi:MAG: LytR/AlgR family response regulator transcription factor [Woeseiaceae bacterium]